jgi:hypothetical protein
MRDPSVRGEGGGIHDDERQCGRRYMKIARRLRWAMAVGCMPVCCLLVSACASTRAVGEPPLKTAGPPPVVDPAPSLPIGPPPGYVEPINYWVREKIILTSEQEPPASAPQKRAAKQSKKYKRTGQGLTTSGEHRGENGGVAVYG